MPTPQKPAPGLIDNPTATEIQACRDEYGEAHDMQVAFSGECAWCGFFDPTVQEGHVDMETGNVYDAAGNMLEQHTF